MEYCNLCRKSFKTEQALSQHNEDSPAHQPVRCEPCNTPFPNAEALAQHTSYSLAHKGNYTCQPCQRSFPNSEALEQHVNNSPKHAPSARPYKSTTSPAAPEQRPLSPALEMPSPNYPCKICTRTFTTADALAQHTCDAPYHNPTHPCPHCPRSFRSASALAQHVRDSPSHNTPAPRSDTPLDAFFLSYPSFPYDRAKSPSDSFNELRAHMRWRRNEPASKDAWELYIFALRQELEVWFGGEDDLGNWQALCRAVGVVPPPATEKGCERALRGTHVNLVDLLAWARERKEEGYTVEVFESVGALAAYCKRTRKWFPLEEVEEAGDEVDGNVVIRHLLRKLRTGRA